VALLDRLKVMMSENAFCTKPMSNLNHVKAVPVRALPSVSRRSRKVKVQRGRVL